MSRNSEYEERQKSKGLKKITVWVPISSEIEFKLMAESCCEDRDYVPSMLRSITTGRMKKGI